MGNVVSTPTHMRSRGRMLPAHVLRWTALIASIDSLAQVYAAGDQISVSPNICVTTNGRHTPPSIATLLTLTGSATQGLAPKSRPTGGATQELAPKNPCKQWTPLSTSPAASSTEILVDLPGSLQQVKECRIGPGSVQGSGKKICQQHTHNMGICRPCQLGASSCI